MKDVKELEGVGVEGYPLWEWGFVLKREFVLHVLRESGWKLITTGFMG